MYDGNELESRDDDNDDEDANVASDRHTAEIVRESMRLLWTAVKETMRVSEAMKLLIFLMTARLTHRLLLVVASR